MKHNITSASALALALAPLTTSAQEAFDLGEIIIFANQTETEAFRVGATVETLDEDEIASDPAGARVSDVLSSLPGISATSNGGLGKNTSLQIRGLSNRYVGVRINGIDVSDPSSTQTQYNWGGLTTAGLSRIEVLKGSQSALYGSEAIAGVVNITTFRPEENGMTYRFGAEIGSFDTIRADASIGAKSDRAELALTLSHIDTDGFSALDENAGNTEADGYTGTTALLSARYALNDQVTIGFEGLYQDEEAEIDDFGVNGDNPDRLFLTERKGARLFAEIDTGIFQHELAVTSFETEREDTNAGGSRFEGRRTEVSYKGVTQLPSGPLTFGLEHSTEEAEFSNGEASYDNIAAFIEHQAILSDIVDLTLSARYDDNSRFGSAVTGRAALAWRLRENTIIRASLATGYRAPSLNELFGPFNFSNPNPDLEPEDSRSAELGIEHRFANDAQIRGTLFYTEIDNLIGYENGNYVQVPGTSKSQGLELSGRLPLADGVSLYAAYTYTDSVDANDARLRRVPLHDIVLGLEADVTERLNGQIVVNRVIDRVDGFPAAPTENYTLVNASFGYDITDSATAYVRIENVFDEEYQTAQTYGTSDRAFYFGIRAEF